MKMTSAVFCLYAPQTDFYCFVVMLTVCVSSDQSTRAERDSATARTGTRV